MAAITICSDFEAQKNKVSHCFHCFPIYFPWSDAPVLIKLPIWLPIVINSLTSFLMTNCWQFSIPILTTTYCPFSFCKLDKWTRKPEKEKRENQNAFSLQLAGSSYHPIPKQCKATIIPIPFSNHYKSPKKDFNDGPVSRTLHFQCRGPGVQSLIDPTSVSVINK